MRGCFAHLMPVQRLRSRRWCALIMGMVLLVALSNVLAPKGWAKMPKPIASALSKAKLPPSAVSISVHAIGENKPRLQLNATTARNPASAIKLVTTWTALEVLGPTHVWPTEIYLLGKVEGDTLEGDLAIKGYGDPFLVIEQLWLLVGELRRTGLRKITGRLLLDDSYYAVNAPPPGAFDNRPHRLYNTRPNALLTNFYATRFHFSPGKKGVSVTAEPDLPNLEIISRVKSNNNNCSANAPKIRLSHEREAKVERSTFTGSLPRQCRRYSLSRSVMHPQAYTYGLFKRLWEQWGGTIKRGFARTQVPADAKPLLTWHSRPLGDIVRPLNKWSNNVMSRLLLFAIGASVHPPPVNRAQGVAVLKKHLTNVGLNTEGLVIDNGAGLSRDTRVTARFMTDLLRYAWRTPLMPEFVSSLSVVGTDGTARRRFRAKPEAGRMHVKTGRLKQVSAIAGYVHARSGKTLTVAVIANHKNVRRYGGKTLENAVLKWAHGL
ncbi:MAG: D-alanyl-D-alanine carboxypeptidase/D-alanyl-D-alanine-endopeptidase [Gammaproteobacteria bacterium]|nr:D-alanyl-D-alanine carboxypeptidase/D-alanyl-D-alanine-endopeptidase [Gammaproteobacteria bacterium]